MLSSSCQKLSRAQRPKQAQIDSQHTVTANCAPPNVSEILKLPLGKVMVPLAPHFILFHRLVPLPA